MKKFNTTSRPTSQLEHRTSNRDKKELNDYTVPTAQPSTSLRKIETIKHKSHRQLSPYAQEWRPMSSVSERALTPKTASLKQSTEALLKKINLSTHSKAKNERCNFEKIEKKLLKHPLFLSPYLSHHEAPPINASINTPIKTSLHELLSIIQTTHFDVKGSSAEVIAKTHKSLDALTSDLDIDIHKIGTHPSKGECYADHIQKRFTVLFKGLLKKNSSSMRPIKTDSDQEIFEAFTHSAKTLKNDGFKFSLKMEKRSCDIDLVFPTDGAPLADTLRATTRLNVEIKNRCATLTCNIDKKVDAWLQKNHLDWFDETIEGGFGRLVYRFTKNPKLRLLQPDIAEYFFQNSNITERANGLYHLLSNPVLSDRNGPLWDTVIHHIRTCSINNVSNRFTSAAPDLIRLIDRHWKSSDKTFKYPSYREQTEVHANLSREIKKRLNDPTLQTTLWRLAKPLLPVLPCDELISLWRTTESDHHAPSLYFLEAITEHYIESAETTPIQKCLLNIYNTYNALGTHTTHPHNQQYIDLINQLKTLNTLNSNNSNTKDWISTKANHLILKAIKDQQCTLSTLKTVFDTVTQLPMRTKHQQTILEALKENQPLRDAQPTLEALLSHFSREQQLKTCLIYTPTPHERDAFYKHAIKPLESLYRLVLKQPLLTEPLPWSTPSRPTVIGEGEKNQTPRSYRIEPNVGFYCGPLSKKGNPTKSGTLLAINRAPAPLKLTPQADGGCPILVGPYRTNEAVNAEIYYAQGERYTGETKHGIAHGQGEYHCKLNQFPKQLQKSLTCFTLRKKLESLNPHFTLKGHFNQGELKEGTLLAVLKQNNTINTETMTVEFKEGFATEFIIDHYELKNLKTINMSDHPADTIQILPSKQAKIHIKTIIFNADNQTLSFKNTTIINRQDQTTIFGDFVSTQASGSTNNVYQINIGLYQCCDYLYQGTIKNGLPHTYPDQQEGFGSVTFATGATLYTRAQEGNLIDPILDKFEKSVQTTASLRSLALESIKSPYVIPFDAAYAYYSCYSPDHFAVVGMWYNGRTIGWIEKILEDNSTPINPIHIGAVYRGHIILFDQQHLQFLSEQYAVPELKKPTLAPQYTHRNGRTICALPHALGNTADTENAPEAQPFFLGIDLHKNAQRLIKEKPFKENIKIFQVESPFFTDSHRPTYHLSWEHTEEDEMAGEIAGHTINTTYYNNYLGELTFISDAEDTTTIPVPDGKGMLYIGGLIIGTFKKGLLDGAVDIYCETGEKIEATFKSGQLTHAITHYINGLSYETDYINNKCHGASTLIHADGTQITIADAPEKQSSHSVETNSHMKRVESLAEITDLTVQQITASENFALEIRTLLEALSI